MPQLVGTWPEGRWYCCLSASTGKATKIEGFQSVCS